MAILYEVQEKFSDAEKYYRLAIEKGDVNALSNLAELLYTRNIKRDTASALILEYNSKVKDDIDGIKKQINIEVWNGKFEFLNDRIEKLLKASNYANLEIFLTRLLYQEQISLVLNLFTDKVHGEELQKRYALLYYAVLLLNNKTGNNLTLRIPPEIMPTVNDIIETVNKQQEFYRL